MKMRKPMHFSSAAEPPYKPMYARIACAFTLDCGVDRLLRGLHEQLHVGRRTDLPQPGVAPIVIVHGYCPRQYPVQSIEPAKRNPVELDRLLQQLVQRLEKDRHCAHRAKTHALRRADHEMTADP